MLFALDRSARTKSVEGHLRINRCVLTRACVSPYTGSEVPDADRFGWRPGQVYQLYRDPAELERAVPTLEGKPLLFEHRPISADDHPKN